MADDEDAPWYRPLVAGVGALVGAALLVGGVISLVVLGVVNLTGLGESGSSSQAEPSLYIPERTGDTDDEEEPGLTLEDLNPDRAERTSPSAAPSRSPEASERAAEKQKEAQDRRKHKQREQRSVVSLSASPLSVSPMERIYLTGTYPGGEGATLQVQRFQRGGWRDFPTSASVSGGTFSTYVMTGQSGPNRFRVVDRASGKASNPVTVRVR